jgi:recA bacterial DNA recombination protein
MSSSLVCAQPATSHPELFVAKIGPAGLLQYLAAAPRLNRVTPASRLEVRPAPDMVPVGIREIDALTGGLPRGCLTEICGPASSGRTSLLLASLAAATRRGEACALVDVSDAFDPQSASATGVNFRNLLWIRCGAGNHLPQHNQKVSRQKDSSSSLKTAVEKQEEENRKAEWTRLEQALKTVDLLLQSGGFGMVAIDLSDVLETFARRISLTSWFRFRRSVENTPTVLLVTGQSPCARTCASSLLRLEEQSAVMKKLSVVSSQPSVLVSHAQLFGGLRVQVELQRSRMERKPMQPASATLVSKTAWTG